MEIKTYLRPYRVDLYCDTCGCEMERDDFVYLSNPPQYKFTCVRCGYTKHTTKDYPYIDYETRREDGSI